MTSFCLNPNLVLNFSATVVLQSSTSLVANSLHIKILLCCFFPLSASSYLGLLEDILCSNSQIFPI